MRSRSPAHIVALLSIISVAGCVSTPANRGNDTSQVGDRYVGTYTRAPFIGTYGNVSPSLDGDTISISKSGTIYRLTGPYADYAFTETSNGVLEDILLDAPISRKGSLGSITAGEMEFADGSPPVQVLKAEFAFEHFLLIKHPHRPSMSTPNRRCLRARVKHEDDPTSPSTRTQCGRADAASLHRSRWALV